MPESVYKNSRTFFWRSRPANPFNSGRRHVGIEEMIDIFGVNITIIFIVEGLAVFSKRNHIGHQKGCFGFAPSWLLSLLLFIEDIVPCPTKFQFRKGQEHYDSSLRPLWLTTVPQIGRKICFTHDDQVGYRRCASLLLWPG